MKILFDTNIILDILLDREPYSSQASILLTKVEQSEIIGLLGATTIITIHYLTTKTLGRQTSSIHIRSLLSLFVIAPVNRVVLENALASGFKDFEDAILHEAARHAGANYIVTRNAADFKKSELPVFRPDELIKMLKLIK